MVATALPQKSMQRQKLPRKYEIIKATQNLEKEWFFICA